jgi:rubrerythrin
MSAPGRPKREYRSAEREGRPLRAPGRPKREYGSAQRAGGQLNAGVHDAAARTAQADAAEPVPASYEAFMAQAIAMENEAAGRYDELADAMEMHNNVDVAALFRKMAEVERKHARSLLEQMGWSAAPTAAAPPWPGGAEGPETVGSDSIHYLMQPYHALQIALRSEERAAEFFTNLAASATGRVRDAAVNLAEEEREHVELVKAWLGKVPVPPANWAEDPDPPRYTD